MCVRLNLISSRYDLSFLSDADQLGGAATAKLLNGRVQLSWRLFEESNEIEITLDGEGSGWIGFGIGNGKYLNYLEIYVKRNQRYERC